MKRRNIYRIIVTLVIIGISVVSIVHGQPPMPPGSHGSNGNQGAGGAAPVDGGVAMLLISGLGYGTVKLVQSLKKSKT